MTTSDDLQFHHVGIACVDLAQAREQWQSLGYVSESAVFEDQLQGIRGQFLVLGSNRIELLQDLDAGRPVVTPWLKRGTIFYHLGFTTANFDGAVAALLDRDYRMVSHPQPSVYFAGRRICFLFDPSGSLLELIDQP
ncbi:MAG: VOC family protein [Gammaproteobacteria bacterium]|nr:VOC family protein [Gammaproteobacteria bacterium]